MNNMNWDLEVVHEHPKFSVIKLMKFVVKILYENIWILYREK
jgi:hypothetical protein